MGRKTAAEIIRAYRQHLASVGGTARAAKLTPQQRQDIARKASRARWKKHRKNIAA